MIVYIDMDDVLCDFTKAIKADIQNNPSIAFPQSQYGFYQNLKPLPGAIETSLRLFSSGTYTPYILTAPSIRNPFSYTEKRIWVENNLGFTFVERLIICNNKGLLKGGILIDDNTTGRGQENFEGRLIHFGSEKFPDWAAVKLELNL